MILQNRGIGKDYLRGMVTMNLLKEGKTVHIVGTSLNIDMRTINKFKQVIPNLEYEVMYSKLEGLADGAKTEAEYTGIKMWLPKN